MPLTYQILPETGLVYIRYWGVATVHDTARVFAEFTQDPQFSPDLKHLVDLKDIVEFEKSFPELMKLQAKKAEAMAIGATPTLLVYYAPSRHSLVMARSALKSWDGLGSVVGRIAQDESEALEMLGIKARQFSDLPMKTA